MKPCVGVIRVNKICVSEIRVSEIRVSEIRVSEIRVSEIRVIEIRVSEIRVSEIRVSKFVLAEFMLTKHIAMPKFFIITFSVMIIFSENIIQHISADVTVATFHEELFGSGHFKISDVVMNSTIILFTKDSCIYRG